MIEVPEKEPHDRTLRQEREGIVGLGTRFPGDEAVAVDGPSNCVTLYCAVDSRPAGLVRANLFAELMGIRQLITSAFLPSGFNGIAAIVTGLHVDGWHASFQATRSDVRAKASLQAARGCSGFRVFVPVRFQTPPAIGDLPPDLVRDNPAPLQTDTGLWRIATEADGPVVTIGRGERVLSIAAIAGGGGGTIAIIASGATQPVVGIPAGTAVEIEPGGNTVGPGTITFAGVAAFTVQLVR